jgi:hypothetical protein
MNVFASTNQRGDLSLYVKHWLKNADHNDATVLDELQRLGIITAQERERMFIEHQCVEHGVIHICDLDWPDGTDVLKAKETWLEVRPDGTCSEFAGQVLA